MANARHNAYARIQAHSKNPDLEIDWAFWTETDNLTNLLQSILQMTPKSLLHMSHNSALETIRQGKVLYHWDFELDPLVTAILRGQSVSSEHVFAMAPLRQSPFLLKLCRLEELNLHPDMITIYVTATLGEHSAQALKRPPGRKHHLIFEMLYDHGLCSQFDEESGALEHVRLLTLPPLLSCLGCRKKIHEQASYCSACKIARYCSTECQKSHWTDAHKATCKALNKLCAQKFDNCFEK